MYNILIWGKCISQDLDFLFTIAYCNFFFMSLSFPFSHPFYSCYLSGFIAILSGYCRKLGVRDWSISIGGWVRANGGWVTKF